MNKRERIGKEHPLFQNGKTISHGYVVLTSKQWGDNQGRYEHRVLMENHLGRKLKRSEIVHHINGNTTDNAIDNLHIVTRQEHNRIHGDGKLLKCAKCGKEKWYDQANLIRLRNSGDDYRCRSCALKYPYKKICKRCGGEFVGMMQAQYCGNCTKKHKKR